MKALTLAQLGAMTGSLKGTVDILDNLVLEAQVRNPIHPDEQFVNDSTRAMLEMLKQFNKYLEMTDDEIIKWSYEKE